MTSLILTIAVVIVVFFFRGNPFLAGLIAVIPVKILGAAAITFEQGGNDSLIQAIKGMLVGQFLWGFALLIVYLVMR